MTRRVNLPVRVSGLEAALVCLVKIPAVVLSVLFCLLVQTCAFYTHLHECHSGDFPNRQEVGWSSLLLSLCDDEMLY